jgi:branched-chain amino acid transport system permease protein
MIAAAGEAGQVLRRTAAVLVAFVAALLAFATLGAGTAFADGEDIHGRLMDNGTPLANVRIVVTTTDDKPVGDVRTGPDGAWVVPLPAAGTYKISLDTSTLPPGEKLTNPDLATVTKDVIDGQQKPQLFPVGGAGPTKVFHDDTNRTAQLIAEGLRFGLILSLAAVGLSLVYGTTGLVNFAHGELVTYGALIAYWLNVSHGLQLVGAAALAVVICGATGWAQDVLFWGKLRKRGTGLLAMMIASIGLALLVRYIFLYFYGGDNDAYTDYRGQVAVKPGPLPIALAPRDYWSMGIAAVALVLTIVALNRTKLGKATRAVADNPALAAASGIDVNRVIRTVWTVGAALAGLAGILLGLAQQVQFQMGQNILLLIFAAVTLGGLGTALGAVLGSLVIGVGIQISTLWVSPELKNVGALGALIVILMVRPQGILGLRERIG